MRYRGMIYLTLLILITSTGYSASWIKYYHSYQFDMLGAIQFVHEFPSPPDNQYYYQVSYTDQSPFVTVGMNGTLQYNTPEGFPTVRIESAAHFTPDKQMLEQLFFTDWGLLDRIQFFSDTNTKKNEWTFHYNQHKQLVSWKQLDDQGELIEERKAEYHLGMHATHRYVIWRVLSPTGLVRWYSMSWYDHHQCIREWHQYDRNQVLQARLTFDYNAQDQLIISHLYAPYDTPQYYMQYEYYPWGGLALRKQYTMEDSLETVWFYFYDAQGNHRFLYR